MSNAFATQPTFLLSPMLSVDRRVDAPVPIGEPIPNFPDAAEDIQALTGACSPFLLLFPLPYPD